MKPASPSAVTDLPLRGPNKHMLTLKSQMFRGDLCVWRPRVLHVSVVLMINVDKIFDHLTIFILISNVKQV